MTYQFSWKPKFRQQSQSIIGSEDLGAQVDTRHLDSSFFGSIESVKGLLLTLGRPYLTTCGQILAISLLLQILSVGSVLLAADALKKSPWLALALTAALYVFLRASITLLTNWTIFKGNRMAVEITGNLIMRLGHHIAMLSPASHRAFSSGNLKTMAITDAQSVGDLIHSTASRGVGFIVAPLIAPIVLYQLAAWPGIWAYFSMLLMIPFSVVTSRRMMRYFNAELKLEDACTTVTGEWLKHQKTARMMLASDFFVAKIRRLKRLSFHEARRGMYWAAFIFGSATRWWVVPPVAMILSAQLMGINLALENLISSIWYISLLTVQLMGIPDLIVRGGKAVAAFRRLADLLKEPRLDAALIDDPAAPAQGKFAAIELENVTLRIDGKEIVSELNLSIDLSLKTAIIGQLGAGKSSLLALLSGQLFPSEGRIILKGASGQHEIRERSAYELWRAQQVLVGQEAFIETSDIKSNVRLQPTAHEASDADLIQSLYDAAMKQDLATFRQGVNEPLGETGINLSGGQKQRLSLARALYSRRDFLFLDDPLSAVDEGVADYLWESLLQKGQGFVIATHRLKYIEACEQIIVMEGGRITAIAHPSDLARQGPGLFLRLRERAALGALR